MEVRHDYADEFKSLLDARESEAVERLLSELHPSDIGRTLAVLDENEAVALFRILSPEVAGEALLELDEHLRRVLISSISAAELIEVVDELETDDAADVISELDAADARQVLEGIGTEEAREVKKLLVYPEDTAGGKMQAELISVNEGATVEEAIAEVRRKGREIANVTNIFVVDDERRLTGVVSLNNLILAAPDQPIKDIIEENPHKVSTDLDQEEVAKIFQRYDLLSMPVVDERDRLVGRITVDDVVDVIEEEIFEDFYKMAGLNVEERALDPPTRSFRMRVPWLLVNLGTAFMAASVIKIFEGTIEKLIVLAVLMPIVAGMGGNAGTQTITVVVRGLALGELDLKRSTVKLLSKEVLVGLANGLMIGLGGAVIAYLLGAGAGVGLLLFLAMIANLVIAGLSGSLIPLMLKWFKVDPAISSSIFVTACTDTGGFLAFLGLATIFMKMGLI